MVKYLLDNDVKENRCTLFQAVSGWRAFVQLSWRAIRWQDVKAPIFWELVRIKPWGKYLVVGRHAHSLAMSSAMRMCSKR